MQKHKKSKSKTSKPASGAAKKVKPAISSGRDAQQEDIGASEKVIQLFKKTKRRIKAIERQALAKLHDKNV